VSSRQPACAGQDAPDADLAATYDLYFASRHYEHRYPVPNPATLAFLRQQGLDHARSMLDLGCGNGRYALALLGPECAALTGCDPSQGALAQFRQHLQTHPLQSRVRLVHGGVEALAPGDRFDVLLLLFGVLGLMGGRACRIRNLQALHGHCLPGARLVLTVPNAWRRLPGARLRALWDAIRQPGAARGSGDVRFWRRIAGRAHVFRYHLFTPAELREELAEAGWTVVLLEADGVLPESPVCRWTWLAVIDGWLRRITPTRLSYGFRVLAIPTQES
jgi:SAM-dependent methyltransferase